MKIFNLIFECFVNWNLSAAAPKPRILLCRSSSSALSAIATSENGDMENGDWEQNQKFWVQA